MCKEILESAIAPNIARIQSFEIDVNAVARRIDELRRIKKQKKKTVARILQVAPQNYSSYTKTDGAVLPSTKTLARIAMYYGVSLMWLLTGDDDENDDGETDAVNVQAFINRAMELYQQIE